MKLKKYIFLIIILSFYVFLAGFIKKISATNKNDRPQKNILTDIEIIDSLNCLLQKYMYIYELEEEMYHDETYQKIQVLSNYINLKNQGHYIQDEEDLHGVQNRSGAFHISPNCTCNWVNYLTETPCANCQYYSSVLDGVYAVLAGFYIRGWDLAADLLTHNLANTILDSDYYPSANLISVISESSQIDRIRYDDKLSDGFEQDEPGWANGIFASTADGDVFNALGKFYYTKNYYSNGYIEINILDRYDWERGTSSPGGVLINNMVNAQELGILTPFYTCIEIVTEGSSTFSWDYCLGGVEINDYYGLNETIILPNQIYDLRYHQQNMINAYVISIDDYVFQSNLNLISASLSTSVHLSTIGNGAFYNCTELENIIMPNSLEIIGANAFKGCIGLETITIPNSVSSIGNESFEGCTSLEDIEIPSSVTSIGYNAFKNCSSLTSIEIKRTQKDLTTLGTNAFQGCSSLDEIIVPRDRVADYKNSSGWSSYRSLIIPNNNDYPYYNLNKYSNINLPNYNIDAGYNIMYQLNVGTNYGYIFTITSGTNPIIKLYNSSFVLIDSDNSSIEAVLQSAHTYYLSVEHSDTTTSGVIAVNIQKDPNHVHIYDDYIWYSYSQHQKKCRCGTSGGYEPHAVSQGSLQPGEQYAACLLCGGLASVGFVGPFGNNEYPTTLNGSYILPNGVVVLVDEDIDAYLDGTLVFNYPNIGPSPERCSFP